MWTTEGFPGLAVQKQAPGPSLFTGEHHVRPLHSRSYLYVAPWVNPSMISSADRSKVIVRNADLERTPRIDGHKLVRPPYGATRQFIFLVFAFPAIDLALRRTASSQPYVSLRKRSDARWCCRSTALVTGTRNPMVAITRACVTTPHRREIAAYSKATSSAGGGYSTTRSWAARLFLRLAIWSLVRGTGLEGARRHRRETVASSRYTRSSSRRRLV